MFYVYILRNLGDGEKYVGFSTDLKTRLHVHQSKNVRTTKKYAEVRLEFYAAFHNKQKALAFEKYLKRGSGFAFANKHLL